jgi:hypothetical protein
MKPLVDINNTYEKFILENKKWCNFDYFKEIIKENEKYIIIKREKNDVSYNIGNFLEKIIKNIWLKKTLSTSKKL